MRSSTDTNKPDEPPVAGVSEKPATSVSERPAKGDPKPGRRISLGVSSFRFCW